MLSRIAESLYWVGRDIERAEGTARILDVHFHLLLEQPAELNRPSCEALLGVMGMRDRAEGRTANAELVNELLAYDRAYPGSIVGALARRVAVPAGLAKSSQPRCGRPSTPRTTSCRCKRTRPDSFPIRSSGGSRSEPR